MEFIFNVDRDYKEKYLYNKITGTAKDIAFTLRTVDEYESEKKKKVYDLSIDERDELITRFPNTSLGSVMKNVSIVTKYIYFCMSEGLVSHGVNRFAVFSKEDAKRFISRHALECKYTTPEELQLYLDTLINHQDQLLLALPYYGVRGRTVKGGTFEEIINLQIRQGSKEHQENILKLVKNNGEFRFIKVPDWLMELVIDTKNQEYYIDNNGETIANRKIEMKRRRINPIGDYVFRIPSQKKYEVFTPSFINGRITKIQKWVGNQYLTISSLYMSGMITMLRNLYKVKGKLELEDYISVADQFDYGNGNPEKYIYNLRDQVSLYIKEWDK